MLSTKAIEILGKAIREATEVQGNFIVIQREMEGLLTREQAASAEVMNYLGYLSGK